MDSSSDLFCRLRWCLMDRLLEDFFLLLLLDLLLGGVLDLLLLDACLRSWLTTFGVRRASLLNSNPEFSFGIVAYCS